MTWGACIVIAVGVLALLAAVLGFTILDRFERACGCRVDPRSGQRFRCRVHRHEDPLYRRLSSQ